MNANILLIEDDPSLRRKLHLSVEGGRPTVESAPTGRAVL